MTTTSPHASPFDAYLLSLFEEYQALDDGEVATYIPELGRADPEWFSICLCTTDGHVYAVGDAGVEFTIQSISKPFVYGAALAAHGRDTVLGRVGVEPSGNRFNAIIVDETNRPFNPMVNAGAIVTTAMVDTEAQIVDLLSRYAGRPLAVDDSVYRSESSTGDRNRAIAFLMQSFGVMADDADAAVDRYFRQCSVGVTCKDLAVMAATLANRGVNPCTGDVALDEPYVESVLSVMSTCGMYDASGEWMFRIGLPAKSGVSGGVVAVLPGQFGIAVFSPHLDAHGNTTRGIRVCERIAADFDLHPMRFQPDVGGVVRRSYSCAETRSSRVRPAAETDVLNAYGSRARILELQGDLYFGTAERVFRHANEGIECVDAVVLDCTRVVRVDASATRLLDELVDALTASGRSLILAGGPGQPSVDAAIERCEADILARYGEAVATSAVPLADQDLLRGLSAEQFGAVAEATRTVHLRAGEVLFKQGDPADSVVFILSGGLSVMLPLGDDVPARRLAHLGAGVPVGEMALVENGGRSATVVADEDSEVAELTLDALAACAATHPDLALRLHENLARVLSERLRTANEQVRLLAG